MARNYEIAFLLREGEPVAETKVRIKEYLDKIKATIVKDDDMGTRELAYIILKNREKFKRAYYYFVYAEAEQTQLPVFETSLKYDTDVIRYMILAEK